LFTTFLSHAGLIVFNATKDILVANANNTIICVAYSLQLLLNIIHLSTCFIVWGFICWYIVGHSQKLGIRIKEILFLIKYLLISKNWSTRIAFIYVFILVIMFWLPALSPF